MYSFPSLEPLSCSMSSSNWYSFIRRQVRWSGIPRLFFKNFPHFAVIHTVKGFGIVNKAEVVVFSGTFLLFQWSNRYFQFDLFCKFSSSFSKSSLSIWKFMAPILLKPGLENFEHYFASMWDECNYVVVWTFFGIAFLWDWDENRPFPVLWPLLIFANLLTYWVQCSTFTASSFRIWNSSTGIRSPPLPLFMVILPKAHFAFQDVWL